MAAERIFVIVGASLAGASAAEELRKQGFDGRVVLIGSESAEPYIRPPLSKDFLAGSEELDGVYVHPHDWYGENAVGLRLGSAATSIDRANHAVSVGAEALTYDKLLIATGSTPRPLTVEGSDAVGVRYLRTMDDAVALRPELDAAPKRIAIIGSGWIGMEVAATARTLRHEVSVLSSAKIPLASSIGDELGRFFADVHHEHGVALLPEFTVEEVLVDNGAATGVRGTDQAGAKQTVPADLVVVAIGATPNVDLAVAAGLEVDNGILVDAALRTSDPDIFAAGDVANAFHPVLGARLRSEHWANALGEGAAAARSMLGMDESYDDIPYFYTDQFELGMEFSGYTPLMADATLVYRGDRAAREFVAFWLADGRVVAGMNVNVWDVNEGVQGVIRRGNKIDLARLADTSVPLEEL
jgi:3-phenylpropionate/trans-cinnamate dioxygenase ferredoxin reductase subunit